MFEPSKMQRYIVDCAVNILAIRHNFLKFLSKISTRCCKNKSIQDIPDG